MENNNFEYGGKCAFALSLGKDAPITNGKHTLIKDGKTYTFLNPVAKFLFKLFPNSVQKANAAWNKN
ncbi:hypothetical protein [Flagellimonas onchidii]|uniref:hypothetical protein n=1 Tax=Flagellimonas onchidii TaxID=2562684 RepID=UPI0010A64916|nr:hypothetical protein [Allomuricauda onchidii]